MSQFVIGVTELLVAWWIWNKFVTHNQRKIDKEREQRAKQKIDVEYDRAKRLTTQLEEVISRKLEKQNKLNLKAPSTLPELDQLVLQDALAREKRAIAALVAVLQQQGCSEEEIASVLETVEGKS